MCGFSTFLTAILKMGLGFSSMQAQYLSVPVYILAGVVFLISAFLSDRFKMRGPIFFLLQSTRHCGGTFYY
nr:BPK_HP1_G0042730.mRNA.1.CDS.1 [Saccharomyces cerevisiae]